LDLNTTTRRVTALAPYASEVDMAARQNWPLVCAVFLWALCPCQLFVPGTSKQARTLRTGRREQVPDHARTVQEQALLEEFQLRARMLRDEASLAEAALAASRAGRNQQEYGYEQNIAPVVVHEEDDSVVCAKESTKPGRSTPARGDVPASSIIARFAACMVVASFWVFVTAGWYAILASTFYSVASDHRMEPVVHGLNHSMHLVEFDV